MGARSGTYLEFENKWSHTIGGNRGRRERERKVQEEERKRGRSTRGYKVAPAMYQATCPTFASFLEGIHIIPRTLTLLFWVLLFLGTQRTPRRHVYIHTTTSLVAAPRQRAGERARTSRKLYTFTRLPRASSAILIPQLPDISISAHMAVQRVSGPSGAMYLDCIPC